MEEFWEFLAELADPESVKDICIPNCKTIFKGGPVLYGQMGKIFDISMVVLQVV